MPLVITTRDLAPLFADPHYMRGAIKALEPAMVAEWAANVRQTALEDPQAVAAGGAAPLRLGLVASEGIGTAVRVQGGPGGRFTMLFDSETNDLLALIDPSYLGVVRVGAEGGLGARYLARSDAKVLGMIGTGIQARTQLPAVVNALPDLEQIKVYSPTVEHRESFCREMSSWLGREIEPVSSVREAIDGSDVLDLVNTSREPIFEYDWIKPGALILTITGRGELPPETVLRARMVCPSWKILAGQPLREPYYSAMNNGTLTKEDFVGEFGEVISKGVNPRQTPDEIVDFEASAVPILDIAIADWAYRWAAENGAGTSFSLD